MDHRYRRKIGSVENGHGVMMHGIAQAAIFGNNCFVRRALTMATNNIRPETMLVRPHSPLPGRKAEQQYPGEDDMVSIRFQKQVS